MEPWHLNLRHLRAVAEICASGSVSAAARTVNISQPAITQAVAKCETLVGRPLFERRHDGMVGTPAALILAPRIRAALDHIGSTRVTMAQLRAFIAVADTGSYTGAARQTGLAPASLHRAIQHLALALRRTLVQRRGKSLILTEAGMRTARAFRLARTELVTALGELAAIDGPDSGRIGIGAMPLSRARLVPTAVTAFHRRRPEAVIVIAEGSWAELIDPLRDGAIDMMIGAMRDPLPADDLVQTPLFVDRPVVLGRRGHPLEGQAPDLMPLTRYEWALPPAGTPLREQWRHLFADRDIALPPVAVECGSVITIRQMLMDSDFLTMLSPDQVAVELEAGWLVRIAEVPRDLTRRIGMTVRRDWQPTPLQADFVVELKRAAAALPQE